MGVGGLNHLLLAHLRGLSALPQGDTAALSRRGVVDLTVRNLGLLGRVAFAK